MLNRRNLLQGIPLLSLFGLQPLKVKEIEDEVTTYKLLKKMEEETFLKRFLENCEDTLYESCIELLKVFKSERKLDKLHHSVYLGFRTVIKPENMVLIYFTTNGYRTIGDGYIHEAFSCEFPVKEKYLDDRFKNIFSIDGYYEYYYILYRTTIEVGYKISNYILDNKLHEVEFKGNN